MILARLEDVSKTYGAIRALDRVSLQLHQGQITLLLGPNGAGKTTLALILAGFLRPSSGTVAVGAQEQPPAAFRRSQGVAFLTESPGPLGHLRVRDLFLLRTDPDPAVDPVGLLNEFGFGAALDRPLRVLSRGQLQVVFLIYALLGSSPLVILDEPDAGLDPETLEAVNSLIHAQTAERGRTALLLTHRLFEAAPLADRACFLTDGQLVFEMSGSLDGPTLKEAYLQYCGRSA